MSAKATEETLAQLHNDLANEFIRRVSNKEASPADLNAARQFLKDNGINCDGVRNSHMTTLMDNMPDFPPELEQ